MKRGNGPSRKTPLKARTGLAATSSPGGGLTRRSPPPGGNQPDPARSSPQRQARAEQRNAWAGLRDLTLGRDGHRCAWCGRYDLALEVHHRAGKGMGGSRLLDHPANLITLHGWGNHTGCHGLAHTDRVLAEEAGMTVPRGTDPAGVPVKYIDGLYRLDDSGDRLPVPGCGPFDGNHTGPSSPGSPPAW